MDILAIIYKIKEFFVTGIHNFPLVIAMTSLVLACATSNMGFIVLFTFLSFIIPLLVWVQNIISPYVQRLMNWILALFSDYKIPFDITTDATCRIATQTGPGPISTFPTFWLSALFFVFFFTFWNGLKIYQFQNSPEADKDKVYSRKAQAIIGMTASIAFFLIFFIWRIMTGCEHWFGILGATLYGVLAIVFFEACHQCNLLRIVDLYGVGSRLMPISATSIDTQVCFSVDNISQK